MNEIVKEFVDALRNPVDPDLGRNYQFHKKELRGGCAGNGYCAEGILCDILVRRFPDRYNWNKVMGYPEMPKDTFPAQEEEIFKFSMRDNDYLDGKYGNGAAIPEKAMTENGIPISIYTIKVTDEISKIIWEAGDPVLSHNRGVTLASLNDRGTPWSSIADIVEIVHKSEES